MTVSALALAGLSAVAAVSFLRLFSDTTSILPAVLAAVLAHGVPRVARSLRLPPAATGLALVGGLALLLTWGVAGHTTMFGLPTPDTAQLLGERLGDGLTEIRTDSPPIGPHSGIVALAAVGVWVAAVTADWVAFRARAMLSAAIPATTLFTLTASLGSTRYQIPLTMAFVALALTFALAHAPAQAGEANAWFSASTRDLGPRAVVRAGLPVVLAATLLAPVLGPRLPDARSAGLVELRSEGEGPRTRVTVSPLVDIRDRLTQRPAVDVFTVQAPRPAYWRMAALETFDGLIWSSLADYKKADGELPADTTVAPTVSLHQEFTISGLAQFWLPAAYRPLSVDLDGARVNPESLTLLTDQATADGLAYSVESAVPDYSPTDFAAATWALPENVRPFVDLPAGTPPAAAELALQVTAGLTSPYDQALAIQNFFRENFEYSEEVPAGHSTDRMTDFLLHARAGFCEQFSSSFAVMARTLGMPSRVAVGFTPGRFDPATGTYTVTSSEAHAWPEVYIDPYGWVAFEPTPGRFNPSPANHTGTFNPDAQQSVPDEIDPSATATTIVPGGDDPATEVTQPPAEVPEPVGADDEGTPWTRVAALTAAALALAVVLGTLAALEGRRRRRRARLAGLDPAASILSAWDDVVAQLRVDGLDVPLSLTPSETSALAGRHEPDAGPDLADLSRLVERAAYSPDLPEPFEAVTAWATARRVVAVLERDDTARRRMRRRLLA